MAKKKKDYINREDFHDEMRSCKLSGKLSDAATAFFMTLSKEVSKDYFYSNPDDADDAVARSLHDCVKYWRGFKENNVVQFKMERNFMDGEFITVKIQNDKTYTFHAKDEPKKNNEFQIGITVNKSLAAFKGVVDKIVTRKIEINQERAIVETFLDTVKKKVTLMDNLNYMDLSIKSIATLHWKTGMMIIPPETKPEFVDYPFIKNEKKIKIDGQTITMFLSKPPNAFSYYTSMVRNAVLKALKALYPKNMERAKMVSISQANNGDSMFNI